MSSVWLTRVQQQSFQHTSPGALLGAGHLRNPDAARENLAGRGVDVGEVQDFPWGRFVFFNDPERNGWAV